MQVEVIYKVDMYQKLTLSVLAISTIAALGITTTLQQAYAKSIFSDGVTVKIISDPWVIYKWEDNSVSLYLQGGNGHDLYHLKPMGGFDNLNEALAAVGLSGEQKK